MGKGGQFRCCEMSLKPKFWSIDPYNPQTKVCCHVEIHGTMKDKDSRFGGVAFPSRRPLNNASEKSISA